MNRLWCRINFNLNDVILKFTIVLSQNNYFYDKIIFNQFERLVSPTFDKTFYPTFCFLINTSNFTIFLKAILSIFKKAIIRTTIIMNQPFFRLGWFLFGRESKFSFTVPWLWNDNSLIFTYFSTLNISKNSRLKLLF